MKNILLVSIIVFASFIGISQTDSSKKKNIPVKAETLKWYSWNEGYAKAKETNKIVLIDIYTDWCGWCKKMDRDTYAHPDVIALLNKYFIAVKFNPEIKNVVYEVDGNKLTNFQLYNNLVQNQNSGYPTTVFLYPKEKRIYPVPGYQAAENFLATLRNYAGVK